MPGVVLATKRAYISADAPNDEHVIPEIQQRLGFIKLIDVPMLDANDNLLGCFEMHDRLDGKDFLEYSAQDDFQITGDVTQLQQVLLNLVTNARHAVALTEAPEIALTLDRSKPPLQLLERIFDKEFFKLKILSMHETRKDAFAG